MGGRRAERSKRSRNVPPGRRRAVPPRRRGEAQPARVRARRPRRRSRRTWVWLAALAVLVVAGVTVPGLLPERTSGPQQDSRTVPAPAEGSAPLSSLPSPTAPADLSALPIAREPFCDRIDERYAAAALDGQVAERTSYGPGDSVSLAPGLTDVAHEFGCVFGSDAGEAKVWVFTAPVTESEARAMVEDARGQRECSYPEDALQYGTPGVVGVCRLSGGRVQVTARGLYGDTWLTCQLTVEAGPGDALARAEPWCLHVATSLGARP